MVKRPPIVALPFSAEELEAAFLATHHEDWVWDIMPIRQPITDELVTYLRFAEDEYRVNLLGNANSARGRALLEAMGAAMTAAIETGYRLAGGLPQGMAGVEEPTVRDDPS